MESIKVYFRNALIGLASMILSSLSEEPNVKKQSTFDSHTNGDDDFHMFI